MSVPFLALPLTRCMTLSKLTNFSKLLLPQLNKGNSICLIWLLSSFPRVNSRQFQTAWPKRALEAKPDLLKAHVSKTKTGGKASISVSCSQAYHWLGVWAFSRTWHHIRKKSKFKPKSKFTISLENWEEATTLFLNSTAPSVSLSCSVSHCRSHSYS